MTRSRSCDRRPIAPLWAITLRPVRGLKNGGFQPPEGRNEIAHSGAMGRLPTWQLARPSTIVVGVRLRGAGTIDRARRGFAIAPGFCFDVFRILDSSREAQRCCAVSTKRPP